MKTLIKLTITAFIITWAFGFIGYRQAIKSIEKVKIQDNCDMNIQLNDCVVISTDSLTNN